jgi:hypothetical protein
MVLLIITPDGKIYISEGPGDPGIPVKKQGGLTLVQLLLKKISREERQELFRVGGIRIYAYYDYKLGKTMLAIAGRVSFLGDFSLDLCQTDIFCLMKLLELRRTASANAAIGESVDSATTLSASSEIDLLSKLTVAQMRLGLKIVSAEACCDGKEILLTNEVYGERVLYKSYLYYTSAAGVKCSAGPRHGMFTTGSDGKVKLHVERNFPVFNAVVLRDDDNLVTHRLDELIFPDETAYSSISKVIVAVLNCYCGTNLTLDSMFSGALNEMIRIADMYEHTDTLDQNLFHETVLNKKLRADEIANPKSLTDNSSAYNKRQCCDSRSSCSSLTDEEGMDIDAAETVLTEEDLENFFKLASPFQTEEDSGASNTDIRNSPRVDDLPIYTKKEVTAVLCQELYLKPESLYQIAALCRCYKISLMLYKVVVDKIDFSPRAVCSNPGKFMYHNSYLTIHIVETFTDHFKLLCVDQSI